MGTAPPFESRFGSDASTLGKTEQMNSRSGPATVVHEVGERIRDVIDCRRWIGVCQDIAERVEGRVPLERLFVQIWYPLCPCPKRRNVGQQYRVFFWGEVFLMGGEERG